jgi:hypothetical protein
MYTKRDLAEWLERLTANTSPGFDPSMLQTVESEGRQTKRCRIKYIPKIPLFMYTK